LSLEDCILTVTDLTKSYPQKSGLFGIRKSSLLTAVDHVSLGFVKSKTTAVVGESGSGKTTLGECILLLTSPDSGSIVYNGLNLTGLKGKELNNARRSMQIVFQDPNSSLNPRMKVRDTLSEPVIESQTSVQELAVRVLESVGLSSDALDRYPHEFSTGQRQRIAIARALMNNPNFMVLDEPTSALDVSIQLQVLNLFRDLQVKYGITYMFITHNLAVAKYTSHFIAVLFSGRIVEYSSTRDIIERPRHPYTSALLSSIPGSHKGEHVLHEKTEEPIPVYAGCRYRLRCPFATEKCQEEPLLLDASGGHLVRCHYYADLKL